MTMRNLICLLIPVAALTFGGCNSSQTADTSGDGGGSAPGAEHEQHDHDDQQHDHDDQQHDHDDHQHAEGEGHDHGGHQHAHGSEGPHGGGLVELGGGAYHAEVVHDEPSGAVTVYLLDEKAEASVAIAAGELTVNLQHDGQGKQFKLAAEPQESDPQGQSSRFVASDDTLGEELDHEHGSAQLVVAIDGKQYRGPIEHHHDGHDHP